MSKQAPNPSVKGTSCAYAQAVPYVKRYMPTKIMNKLLAFLLMLPVAYAAADEPEVANMYLDRPIWALGLHDAKWLVPKNPGSKSPIFAFFSFSSQKTNMPDKPTEQREDNTGRTTRSLPLYLAERINVETNCRAENHVFVVKNSGPVVSGQEWDIKTLMGLFKSNPPDYFVTGHIVQDYLDLRSTITLKIWDVKGKKELIELTEARLFSEAVNVASKLPSRFSTYVGTKGLCSFQSSSIYPAPSEQLLSPYLDALGQLLIQSLAENKVVPPESIWGEEDMLNWYLTLRKHMPFSDAPKLMYVRGVLASVDYGGATKQKYVPGLIEELKTSRVDDVLFKLSPLVYAKLKDHASCEKKKLSLKRTATGIYRDWLNTIDCKAYNKSLNRTRAADAALTG